MADGKDDKNGILPNSTDIGQVNTSDSGNEPHNPSSNGILPNPTNPTSQHTSKPTFISLNIPRFYKPDPSIFFINVESQFTLAGITSEADKFVHLTAKLEPEILAEVAEVLRDPQSRTYSVLKAAILKRFSQSEEQRLNTLLGTMEMGDKQPSQILREIQRLAGGTVPESIVRGLWLKKLPTFTQQILQAVSTSTPLYQQAEVADKVMSVSTPNPAVSAVSSSSPTNSNVQCQVDELCKQVNELRKQLQDMKFSQNRSRSRSRSSQPPADSKYCYIHYRYKHNARRCAAPGTCKFLEEHPSGNSQPSSC